MRHLPTAVAALCACLGCSAPPEPMPEPLPTPNPLRVAPIYEQASEARGVFGRDGGTLVATTDAGARVELTIPAGALAMPTAMTLTPITGVGYQLGGPVVAGAQLDPPSLFFAKPATLTLTPPGALAGGPVTMALTGLPRTDLPTTKRATPLGELAVLVETPVCQGGVLTHVTVPVTTGTSAILLDGDQGTLQIVQQHAPANACMQMEGAFLLKRISQHLAAPCGPIDDDLSMVLNDLYFQLVNPVLNAAIADDKRFNEAMHTFYCWAALVDTAGNVESRVLSGNLGGGKKLLSEAANHVVDGAAARCATYDLTAARDLAKVLQLLVASFIDPGPQYPNLDVDVLMNAYSKCMTFSVEGTLEASFDAYPIVFAPEEDHGHLKLKATSATFYPSVTELLSRVAIEGHSAYQVLDHFELHANWPPDDTGIYRYSIAQPADCSPAADPTGRVQLEVFRFDGINLTDPSGPSADLDFGFQARPCIRETYTGGATRYYARDLTHAFYVSAGQSDRVFKLANWSANAAPGNPVFATMTLTSGLTQTPDGEPGSGQLSWLFKLVHTPR